MDRHREDRAELNLLPMMNLVSLLIPLLLMGTQLVALSSIEVQTPRVGEHSDAEALNLSLRIEPHGFVLEGAQGVLGSNAHAIPCPGGCDRTDDWPIDELVQRLIEVKAAHPATEQLAVIPDSAVTYQVIVRTLDASREHRVAGERRELFPTVRIGSR